MIQAKDLSKEAPRSPYDEVAGFALLARAIDKCRATIASTNGEYRFNCPLDRMLFSFAKINAEEFKAKLESGVTDDEIGKWVNDVSGLSVEDILKWTRSIDGQFDNVVHGDKESFS